MKWVGEIGTLQTFIGESWLGLGRGAAAIMESFLVEEDSGVGFARGLGYI